MGAKTPHELLAGLDLAGLDELVGPLVRFLSTQIGDDVKAELRIATCLRDLALGSEMTLAETHKALHQLLDQKVLRLVDDELVARDCGALSAAMNRLAEAS